MARPSTHTFVQPVSTGRMSHGFSHNIFESFPETPRFESGDRVALDVTATADVLALPPYFWDATEPNHGDLTDIYLKARQEAVRTVSALGNIRRRELETRLDKQVSRMQLYYEDLRKELNEQDRRKAGRPAKEGTEAEDHRDKSAKRLETINREELQRISELRHKSALKITLRLANLLIIEQPKICVKGVVSAKRGGDALPEPMESVWNPLTEQLEAASCPVCGGSTFEFRLATKKSKAEHPLVCPQCFS